MLMARSFVASVGLAGLGFALAGCCLLRGNPTVTSVAYMPQPATAGQPVTFTAQASGGSAPYTYNWSFGGSGSTAMWTFTSPGTYPVAVTVIDNCGKAAVGNVTVSVTGDSPGGGGNLNGTWNGSRYDRRGVSYELRLRLDQQGTQLIGTVYLFGYSSPGSGSFIGGRFMFSFQWPGTTVLANLVGTYNAALNELRGDLVVGGDRYGTWDVRH